MDEAVYDGQNRLFPRPKEMDMQGEAIAFRLAKVTCSWRSSQAESVPLLGTVRARLRDMLPLSCPETHSVDAVEICLHDGLHGPPPGLTVAECAFLARDGQAYVIAVESEHRCVRIAGGSPVGLLYAVITLGKLLSQQGTHWVLPGVYIRDCPDTRYRGIDWLLNAEANRWGYDWGDGTDAIVARLERRLDMCLDAKINVVQFDGFGWDWENDAARNSILRRLNGSARARGIRLVFGGYGGGYGACYQTQFAAQGTCRGRVFHNRRRYPDGDSYACQGSVSYAPEDPRAEVSRHLGTCLSNGALQKGKIGEIVQFVRAVEPGALYIHDLDTGNWSSTQQAWRLRCPDCRARWPNDEMAAADGQAGAYAWWFTQVLEAVAQIVTPSGYRGDDCLLMFVGPLYTSVGDSDDVWDAEREYFRILSGLLPVSDRVLFGIREQLGTADGGTRCADLGRVLEARGHGVMVCCFAAADLYHDDRLFTPLPALAHWFRGAQGVNMHNGHVHQDALQVANASFLWTLDGLGKLDPAALGLSGSDCLAAVKRADPRFWDDGRLGRLLLDICGSIFGPGAAAHMAFVYEQSARARYPAPTVIWFTFTRRLWRGENLFAAACEPEWEARLSATDTALARVGKALASPDCQRRDDLMWLRNCLWVGRGFLDVLLGGCRAIAGGDGEGIRRTLSKLDALESHCRDAGGTEHLDPEGGDVATWLPAVVMLRQQVQEKTIH